MKSLTLWFRHTWITTWSGFMLGSNYTRIFDFPGGHRVWLDNHAVINLCCVLVGRLASLRVRPPTNHRLRPCVSLERRVKTLSVMGTERTSWVKELGEKKVQNSDFELFHQEIMGPQGCSLFMSHYKVLSLFLMFIFGRDAGYLSAW